MLRASAEHYRRQQRLTATTVAALRRAWRRVDVNDLDATFPPFARLALTLLVAAQRTAAADGAASVGAALAEQGLADDPFGQVVTAPLIGVASDGRPLDSLIYSPITTTKSAIGTGASPDTAMQSGLSTLELIAATQVQDAARAAAGIGVTARPRTGYVRMLNPPSCSRCAILAGKFFKWNAGFQRHPRCDCRHVPTQEDVAGDLTTDPKAYFSSLTASEQNRIFTSTGAQAIRDGADIGQVVNARRGAFGMAPAGKRLTNDEIRMLRGGRERGGLQTQRLFGRDLYVTTEGTTRRGIAGVQMGAWEDPIKVPGQRYRRARAPRLMPESIYQIAGADRDEAIRLLRRFGYLT